MKPLLLTLSLLFLSLPSFGLSQERPETIVIPVSSVGDVTETRKLILQNTLEDELKTHFRLISQDRFEEAQGKAFEELDFEECTEDQCIILIQEMLQVENVFHLQVIGEGNDTQLSLNWRTLDEKRKETDVCMGCGTFQLNNKVGGLVEKLVGKSVPQQPVVVVEKLQRGVLFERKVNGVWGWFRDGKEYNPRYVGEIKNGVPDGKGTITSINGNKYVGEWKNGEKNGQGIHTSSSGDKFEGEFKDGLLNGQGIYTSSSGNKYEGEFKDWLRNGKGTFTWSNGDKYVGEWKYGTKNGLGKQIWGKGKWEGDVYEGEWKDGEMNGQGTLTWSSGNKYFGKWMDGKINGQGTYTYSNGNKYVGEFKDNKRNGQGIMTSLDGMKYEGKWKSGLPNGQGIETNNDGTNYIGLFRDGIIWNGKVYDKNGILLGIILNGVVKE